MAAPARRQARQAAAGTSFEDHLHGFVDLEGENPEDDARASVVGAEQRQFLAEVDQSRRQQQRQQRPRSGGAYPPCGRQNLPLAAVV